MISNFIKSVAFRPSLFQRQLVKTRFSFSESKDEGLKLYYHVLSQPSRSVMALLLLGKIPHQVNVVELHAAHPKVPEYKRINKFETIPCLVHNGSVIGESNAILTYLC